MSRMARVVVPDYPHHVVQRGNRRQDVFFDDGDYRRYVALLAEHCMAARVAVWAWCLMPNHVHLVLVPSSEDGLREALGRAHRRYTLEVNQREGWTGYLWQGRFSSTVMDEPHTLTAIRYVAQNPVRAGLCRRPEDWSWSRARALLGRRRGRRADPLTDREAVMGLVPDWPFLFGEPPPEEELDGLRLCSRTGRPLGGEGFIDTIEALTQRRLRPAKRGRPPKHDPERDDERAPASPLRRARRGRRRS